MNYGFTLEFEELSNELQDQKIDEVITYNFDVGNIENENTFEDSPKTLNYQLQNEKLREQTREHINMHFPTYF